MTEPVTYDYTSPVHSPFLRLKSKGDVCKIRIVSDPIKFQNVYQGKQQEKFAWLVIDRNVSLDDEYVIKIFTAGKQVWDKIKTFYKDPDWGDVMTYDLTVTRTENSAADYYSVSPSPNNKGALTTEEMALVMATQIDLSDAIEKSTKPRE